MKDRQQDKGQDDRHGQGAQAAEPAGEEEKHLAGSFGSAELTDNHASFCRYPLELGSRLKQ